MMFRPRAVRALTGVEAMAFAVASVRGWIGSHSGSQDGSHRAWFAPDRTHPRFLASLRTAVSETPNFFASALIDRVSVLYTSPI
jgi:hypothetical protein